MALPENPRPRLEQYLNRIATGSGTIPEKPRSRLEEYLDYIVNNEGGQQLTVLQTTLLDLVNNMEFQSGADRQRLLDAYCNSVGLDGVISVKYKAAVDGSSGAVVGGGTNRETSDFIDVDGFTAISATLNAENQPYPMWFAVRCYDANKGFIGAANPTGTVPASRTITFAANTKYIRLMFTPDTGVAPSGDLKGVYTGHTIKLDLTASSGIVQKTFYLSEVPDFQ